jgi:hypothetical protein
MLSTAENTMVTSSSPGIDFCLGIGALAASHLHWSHHICDYRLIQK